jgi:hypothetical protein
MHLTDLLELLGDAGDAIYEMGGPTALVEMTGNPAWGDLLDRVLDAHKRLDRYPHLTDDRPACMKAAQ